MTITGLDTFDTSIHATNRWLKIMMEELGTDDRRMALAALRASLHSLRDRIGPENAAHFAAQLPMMLRGLFYEGWKPAASPTRERHLDDFLFHLDTLLPEHSILLPAESAIAAFATIAQCLPRLEVSKIIALFPKELRTLWPSELFYEEAELAMELTP